MTELICFKAYDIRAPLDEEPNVYMAYRISCADA